MRIIAGKSKGVKLKTPDGSKTRPTLDRVRESYFNIIGQKLEGESFLDACAGTGSMGLEALSRKARRVIFVEREREMTEIIRRNLSHCGFTEGYEILREDAADSLEILSEREKTFDYVYFSPPYRDHRLYDRFLKSAAWKALLGKNSILTVQHEKDTPVLEQYPPLTCYRVSEYGRTFLSFFKKDDIQ